MVVLADRANIRRVGRAVFGERFDVVELDIIRVVNRMIVGEAVEHAASTLLLHYLLLFEVCDLSFE